MPGFGAFLCQVAQLFDLWRNRVKWNYLNRITCIWGKIGIEVYHREELGFRKKSKLKKNETD